jgi:tRNA1(Val) A37 N6-methylase TrmN6
VEVVNDLLDYNNLKIVQNSDWFAFSLDSVLLANFVTINKGVNSIIDLGTGNAPIPLILSTKTSAHIYGIEIQKEIYDMAVKSVSINKLENKITIINDNFKNMGNKFLTESFDIVISNPPYFKYQDDSQINDNFIKIVASLEIYGNVEDVIRVSRKILKNNGVLALVHRPERLVQIIELFRKYNLEPKRLQFVYPKLGKEANAILIEGRKNGKSGLKVLAPLYIHNNNGEYKSIITRMFKNK